MSKVAPLHERIPVKNNLSRAIQLLNFLLLLCLLTYRFLHLGNNGPAWHLAFICESWFTFMFFLSMNTKWNPVEYRTYPQRLLQQFPELPLVDMFVTTADSTLEPPIITVNTVLSLLSVDYPAHKLACYVSDDGASAVTFYSLVQALEFSKLWVPFCKKYNVRVRAPSAYFSTEPHAPERNSSHFFDEWRETKEKYEALHRKIEMAADNLVNLLGNEDYAVFSKIEHGNQPSIIKVIWENTDDHLEAIPHLVYVAREKRPKWPHHYKAGAMNVLTRVSGAMTNAPFMLNVDCDMYVNDPQVILHAMCLLLGTQSERESGFVQTPQFFYGTLKDDPFGNQFVVGQKIIVHGLAGLQGPAYGGTGCVHRRKIIYGQTPEAGLMSDKLNEESLQRKVGNSKQFAASVARLLCGGNEETNHLRAISSNVEAAIEVASCSYEFNTCWGDEVGWVYGSATEDVLTGIKIHSMGWRSTYLTLDPPAFLGCAPPGGPAALVQMKRWTTGLLEIIFTKYGPVLAVLTKKLELRQSLAYFSFLLWAPRSVPEMCYSLLPAYCLLSNNAFLPRITEPAMVIPAGIFVVNQLNGLSEFISCRQSVRAWWNTQRMTRIISATSGLFGILSVFLKLLRLSETIFEVTPKTSSTEDSGTKAGSGWFKFDSSPIFVPGLGLLFIHMVAFSVGLWRLSPFYGWEGIGVGEMVCSAWLMLCFLPFLKGLFRKGSYGIPWSVIMKASVLALLFIKFCLN
ncbi:cellulose synthase-like protein H1 [Aristolochia californica]|uniref:cellulose synthase-like protein H1 n=1 Tax=Aristolochia californica TaxID=171875 RepID=UPI0035E00149